MRILSQTGMIDLTYESVGISINHSDNTKIVAYPAGNYNKEFGSWKMAEYSTAEKAQKAMEMLRKAYSPILVIQEQDEAIKPNIKPNDWLVTPALPTHRIEVMDNFYFQFPSDDEIEV